MEHITVTGTIPYDLSLQAHVGHIIACVSIDNSYRLECHSCNSILVYQGPPKVNEG